MALSKPIIRTPIAAFDATNGTTVYYDVVGGDLPTKNKFKIITVLGATLYESPWIDTYNNYVVIPNDITITHLQNGNHYFIVVQTGRESEDSPWSNQVQFYCYNTPTFEFTDAPQTVPSSTYTFVARYNQTQGELLNTYVFTLYNAQNVEVATSGVQYASSLTPIGGVYTLSYTFGGLLDGQSFKIGLKGETTQHTILNIEPVTFTVNYTQEPSMDILTLNNVCNEGKVVIQSKLNVYAGQSERDVTYPFNKEASLINNSATWENIDLALTQDFTTYLTFRAVDLQGGGAAPDAIRFVIEGTFDEYTATLWKNGAPIPATEFKDAINSGRTVIVTVHDQSRKVFVDDPIKYTISANGNLALYFITETGQTYSPELYVLRESANGYVDTLEEYDYSVSTYQQLYANANNLPFSAFVNIFQLGQIEQLVSIDYHYDAAQSQVSCRLSYVEDGQTIFVESNKIDIVPTDSTKFALQIRHTHNQWSLQLAVAN